MESTFTDDSYFVGLSSIGRDNRSYKISTPSVHIRRGLLIKFDPNFDVSRNMKAESIVAIILGTVTLILIISLIMYLTVRHAKMHPASYPGQILVRLQLRGYTVFNADNRRDSIATTSTIVAH